MWTHALVLSNSCGHPHAVDESGTSSACLLTHSVGDGEPSWQRATDTTISACEKASEWTHAIDLSSSVCGQQEIRSCEKAMQDSTPLHATDERQPSLPRGAAAQLARQSPSGDQTSPSAIPSSACEKASQWNHEGGRSLEATGHTESADGEDRGTTATSPSAIKVKLASDRASASKFGASLR